MSLLSAISAAAILASLIPKTQAHMAVWHPSQYGFNGGDHQPVTPLAGKSFNQWWFHGFASDSPKEVMSITPGQPLQLQISCRKSVSAYGSNPSTDACPIDSGAYHAGGISFTQNGWQGNSEDSLTGCALAIAPKSSAGSTNPEDFVVVSIQERCVRQRDTTFQIPANLPACPDGECTCAWFWQGKNSQDEMYMTGFRCNIEGGSATSWPTPALPRQGKIKGPTQPMYWANDQPNIGYTPTYDNRPTYNSKWGWTDGAQTSAFGGSGAAPVNPATPKPSNPTNGTVPIPAPGGSGNVPPQTPNEDEEETEDPAPAPAPAPGADTPTTTRTRRPRPSGTGGRWRNRPSGSSGSGNAQAQPVPGDGQNLVAQPSANGGVPAVPGQAEIPEPEEPEEPAEEEGDGDEEEEGDGMMTTMRGGNRTGVPGAGATGATKGNGKPGGCGDAEKKRKRSRLFR